MAATASLGAEEMGPESGREREGGVGAGAARGNGGRAREERVMASDGGEIELSKDRERRATKFRE